MKHYYQKFMVLKLWMRHRIFRMKIIWNSFVSRLGGILIWRYSELFVPIEVAFGSFAIEKLNIFTI